MLSTLLELLGFAAFTAASYLLGGLTAALIVGGAVLLLVGYSTDDQAAVVALSRVVRPLAGRVAGLRARRLARRATPAKA